VSNTDPRRKSLRWHLKRQRENLVKALAAKEFHLEFNRDGNIVTIADPMMAGDLTDSEFALLASLPHLKRLWLRGVRITNRGLAALSRMPQIKELLLEGKTPNTKLTDDGLVHLKHLPTLTQLHLEDISLNGPGLDHIQRPECIRDLDFTRSTIDDRGLAHVSRFTNLRRLSLWDTSVSDAGLRHLKGCKKLESLDLYSTRVTNRGINTLASFPAIRSLTVSDTRVNDGCLKTLLEMPKLDEITFGERQVSVQTVERLRKAGVKVEHGTLLHLKRKDNYLRYLEIDFEVDPKRSALRAYLNPQCEAVGWAMEIECTGRYVPHHMQPAHLEGPPFGWNKTWRELTGQIIRVAFKTEDYHPILPDNLGIIYVGWHAFPNNHEIRFVRRRGNRFQIDWKCQASEGEWDPGSPVRVVAEVPFVEVVVYSDQPLSLSESKELFSRHFDAADFGRPSRQRNYHQARYRFPVRSAVK
jgi:hypothetical protein